MFRLILYNIVYETAARAIQYESYYILVPYDSFIRQQNLSLL